MVTVKLEVTIKINELPEAQTIENNWQKIEIDCDGRIITVTVKSKMWKRLTDAATNYLQWVPASADKIGQSTKHGLYLTNPTYKFSSAYLRLNQCLKLLEKNLTQNIKEVTKVNNQNLARCENNQNSVRSSRLSKEVKKIQTI
ncbi:MAG: hypothetical protein KME23_09475 [Goleter apudmare HA4340-LM2]|jgi:tRNA threonylcarbamoyladenosine modification (KEOPS) complex  Pcc1 subunit|nr:hypothetical protein [Goleter apudmare HA4340-LM2]